MSTLKATVIVPTSIDRGPLLPYSVGSILNQTVRELEVFIIGDGVHEVTREAARALERQDARVRFFDHPKGPRRGEIYRHQALQEARGEIVCYLCDRDLYWPNHLEEMARLLEKADYAHTLIFRMLAEGLEPPKTFDLSQPTDRRRLGQSRSGVPLSFSGHTLAMYRQLPEGWATTPAGQYTDIFLAKRFIRHDACRLASGLQPTVLNFPRGVHPGLSTSQRLPELKEWASRLAEPTERTRLLNRIDRARAIAHTAAGNKGSWFWSVLLLPFQALKQEIDVQVFTRPDHPVARRLRNWWRRLKGKPTL